MATTRPPSAATLHIADGFLFALNQMTNVEKKPGSPAACASSRGRESRNRNLEPSLDPSQPCRPIAITASSVRLPSSSQNLWKSGPSR